jgi:hypothetical protein
LPFFLFDVTIEIIIFEDGWLDLVVVVTIVTSEVSDDHRLNINIASVIVESHVIEKLPQRNIAIELLMEVDFTQMMREWSPQEDPLELGDTTPLPRIFEKLLVEVPQRFWPSL